MLWSLWRDTVVIAKTALVASIFMTAISVFSLFTPGAPWPFFGSMAGLASCLWLYASPPGRKLGHHLLDAGRAPVFDAEGVQFTVMVPPSLKANSPLILEVQAENCWSAERVLEFQLGAFHTPLRLGALEGLRSQVVIPAEHLPEGKGHLLSVVLDVEAFGWRGRRVKPRRAQEIAQQVKGYETAALLLVGILRWGGGVRLTTKLEP
ncbi:MAG: hypothetical protein Q8S33_13530 [Myxococcales bacterium]|nr:hypothetical protein [Myxococcales bacterium]